jgi:hypothetical protein
MAGKSLSSKYVFNANPRDTSTIQVLAMRNLGVSPHAGVVAVHRDWLYSSEPAWVFGKAIAVRNRNDPPRPNSETPLVRDPSLTIRTSRTCARRTRSARHRCSESSPHSDSHLQTLTRKWLPPDLFIDWSIHRAKTPDNGSSKENGCEFGTLRLVQCRALSQSGETC